MGINVSGGNVQEINVLVCGKTSLVLEIEIERRLAAKETTGHVSSRSNAELRWEWPIELIKQSGPHRSSIVQQWYYRR